MKKKFDLKVTVTLLLVTALIVGLFTDKILAQDFIPLVSLVLTFYFVKNKKKEDK